MMKCNICGCKDLSLYANKLRDSDKHKVYKCKECNHIFLQPLPTEEEDRIYFDEDKQVKFLRSNLNINEVYKREKHNIHRRARMIEKEVSKDKRILDVGSGYGLFLKLMGANDYNIEGMEISKIRRKISNAITDVEVHNFDLTKGLPFKEKYDIITLFHVLEHSLNPVGLCKGIYKTLNDNGTLYIEVPNVDEYMLKYEPYNKFYWQRGHINYFHIVSLNDVIQRAGFRLTTIIYEQRWGICNLFNWLTTNKPQINEPIFNIDKNYRWLEAFYRNKLIEDRVSDTMIMKAYKMKD